MKKILLHASCWFLFGLVQANGQQKKTVAVVKNNPSPTTTTELKGNTVKSSKKSASRKVSNVSQATSGMSGTNPPLFSGISGYRTWSVGITGGGLAPFSPFGGRNDFARWRANPGYGIYVKKQVTHIFGIQANYVGGLLRGDNKRGWQSAPLPSPYSSFETKLNWAASVSTIAILGNIDWARLHTSFQPYATIGAGAMGYKPVVTTTSGKEIAFNDGKEVNCLFYPVGLGFKAKLGSFINLDMGFTTGFVDGDDLDGYQTRITFDKFVYGHTGLEFIIGKKSKPQLARHNPAAQLAQELKKENKLLQKALEDSTARYNKILVETKATSDSLKLALAELKADKDGDGVSDFFDRCPATPSGERVDGAGCSLPNPKAPIKDTVVRVQQNNYYITETDKSILKEAVSNMEFDAGKATLKPSSFPYLDKVANLIIVKGAKLKLSGYTDNQGNAANNLKLSKQRTETIKAYLVKQGANADKIEAVGYGSANPIASNKTTAGRQKNRRVEFSIN